LKEQSTNVLSFNHVKVRALFLGVLGAGEADYF
jgi:hypothetical protein